ncbi:OB-fold nucleic acid binding domain-containing protein [Streptomyces sp. NPDC051940]|uniref:OB-fold nucleic acid binding domain-containing protein n=1 Tax=Streptomyces sp. NPDC051940 TaxID=3155675 RepID=UPI003425ED61
MSPRSSPPPTGRFRRMMSRISGSAPEPEGDVLPGEDAAEQDCAPIRECHDRQVVKVAGTLRTVTMQPRAGTPALQAELFDGEDSLDVVWLGRRSIAGVEPGRRMIASGRVAMSHGRRVLFNPKYELRPTGQE